MTGPDISKPSGATDGDTGYGVDSAGGVTTVTHSSEFPAATPFSDDSPNSPYGTPSPSNGTTTSNSNSTSNPSSTWTGSPYEPLPTDSSAGEFSASSYSSYDATPSPTYIAPPPSTDAPPAAAPSNGKQTKSRALAGLVSAVLGLLLVGGGLYLIGEFGFRIFDVMLNIGGQPSPWDIAWTSTGAALIFVAVLLNGWSPWATLLPGLGLTAAGVWSIAWYDGADRVASSIDRIFARPEMVVWGITGWLLVLGLILTGASGAAIIARAAGRRRERAQRA
jgi:hypothetical protein